MPVYCFSTRLMVWRYYLADPAQPETPSAAAIATEYKRARDRWLKLEELIGAVLHDFPVAQAAVTKAVKAFVSEYNDS